MKPTRELARLIEAAEQYGDAVTAIVTQHEKDKATLDLYGAARAFSASTRKQRKVRT